MKNQYKHEVINDRMSADEIARIVCSDLNKNFNLTMHRKLNKISGSLTKSEYTGRRILATISIIGKSGQKYRVCLHHITMPDGTITVTVAILVFIVVHTDYGIVYMTVSFGDDVKSILECDTERISINRYTDHVVHRYGERHGGEYYGEDGFIRMIIENFNFEPYTYDGNRLMARITNGALVGKVVKGKNCFNSFYTEEMILSKPHLRELYNSFDVSEDSTYYCVECNIKTILSYFDKNLISITELVEKINAITENVKEEFYEQSGISKEYLNSEIQRRVAGGDALYSPHSDRSPLQQTKSKILCVESIVPRLQSGVPTIQRFSSFRGFQNC